MIKLGFTGEQLNEMQRMRDNGVSLRKLADIFECSATYVLRHTAPPPKVEAPEPPPKVVKRRRFTDDEEHQVRVLSSVPSGFKAPSRGMGW